MLQRILLLVSCLFISVVAGCSTDPGEPGPTGPLGPRGFGERCMATEDCASGLCIRIDASGGICSRTCANDAECPAASNWKCVTPSSLGASVCGCRKSAKNEICGNGVDDDCDAKIDDCLLCDGKLVEPDDREHCGGCNRACRADQVCSGGACKCTLDGRRECGGRCVDLTTDFAHCGACDAACSAEQACKDGVCSCPTSAEPDACPSGCVNKKTDAANCGSCGNVCGSGQVCREGKCTCPTTTEPDVCSTGCVDLQRDEANCGACGKACPAGFVCNGGTCGCPNGTTACGDVCVNTSIDSNNCGACGKTCRFDQLCTGGACLCQSGTDCGGQCVSTTSDANNCGGCGIACRPGEWCGAGGCRCDSGMICDGACKPMNDPLNCGACGNACSASQYCGLGVCRCNAWGMTACGAACVDTATSLTNCGACGNTCRPSETCSAGRCTCPSGQTWCDAAGGCVDLRLDTTNCGACGRACGATEVCSFGNCRCPTTGNLFCASASACVDIASNDLHCGGCDNACPADTRCTTGRCKCTAAGRSLCGSSCVDTQTDELNCGACGAVCPGTQICNAGKCQCEAPIASTPYRITNAPLASSSPTLVWNGTHAGLAWLDARNTIGNATVNVFFTLLNADGTRASADLQLTSFPGELYTGQIIPTAMRGVSVIWTGTQWTVAWPEAVRVGTAIKTELRLRGITPAGALGTMDVTVAPTGIGGDTRIDEASVAWSSTHGYAVVYGGGAGAPFMFRRLGIDATAPETPVSSATDGDTSTISGTRLAASPSGEWGALVQRNRALWFVRFNADGSRTKDVVALPNVVSGISDIIPEDASSWLTTFVREEYVLGKLTAYLTIARGNDLSARSVLERVEVPSGPLPYPLTAPRLMLDGTTLDVVFARVEALAGTSTVQLKRWTLPPATGVAPVVLADRSSILPTSNHQLYTGLAAARVGPNSLMATWADNRWGDREIYGSTVDLRMCP